MGEFSAEDIESAANEVRRGGFGDFMFGNPSQVEDTSQRQTTSNVMLQRDMSSQLLSSSSSHAEPSETAVNPTRFLNHTGWRNSIHGNTQMNIGWENGNMWELRIRKRV